MLKISDLKTNNPYFYLKNREIGNKQVYKGYRILINTEKCYTNMWNIADLISALHSKDSKNNNIYIMQYLQRINEVDIKHINNSKILLIIDLEHLTETPNLDYLYMEDDIPVNIKHVNVGFVSMSCDKITSNNWIIYNSKMLK